MDFDLALADLDTPNTSLNMQNIPNMHPLNMHPIIASTADPAPAWAAPADLVPASLPETLALAGLPQATIAELTAPIPLPPPSSAAVVGHKRSHAQMDAAPLGAAVPADADLSSSHATHADSSTTRSHALSHAVSHSTAPLVKPCADEDKTPATAAATAAAAATPCPAELLPVPEIDNHAVCQMGGLPYAELCKERAREEFKEAKRNEHLANGDFDRTKRRKKNDTSMTPRQKYVRRLRMNQDSAAAARHAQEVYVSVLEKLVKTSEAEKKTFSLEMQHIRKQNSLLQNKVRDLQDKVTDLEEDNEQLQQQQQQRQQQPSQPQPQPQPQPPQTTGAVPAFDWEKTKDPILASKLLDFIASTPMVGAQVDIGVQPARAV